MPRHPDLSREVRLRESVFARLADRIARHGGPLYPLHIGDTCFDPPLARVDRIDAVGRDDLSRYGHPHGLDDLIDAFAAYVGRRAGAPVARERVQVTAGATHGLACAARAVLAPGDECLVLAPYWPLIGGIVTLAGAVPVEVPFYRRLYEDPSLDAAAIVEPHVTARTAALYVTTPNNPDGKVLSRLQLASLADLARRHRLWVLSDECYEAYVYQGEHVSIVSLPACGERTFAAYSLSKSHALAGLRVGALVGPSDALASARRVANHTIYNLPVVAQRAAIEALGAGEEPLATLRERARRARDLVVRDLRARFHAPEGGAYVFCDFAEALGERPLDALLDRLLDAGVALAPGEAFGRAFARCARLCFTACPEPDLAAAVARINEVLAAWR